VTLGKVIQWFKTMTTNEYMRAVRRFGWPAFQGRLWLRNYHEHVVRDEASLERIRRYIVDNPAHWMIDRENPEATNFEPENAWRL
jgi:REP element-mobilizing transposase RayT